MVNSVGTINAEGGARIQVGNIYQYINTDSSEEQLDQKCLEGFRSTDPRHDKKRIEDLKGGLVDDSYRWILRAPEFLQWRDKKDSRVLWITGDPGKGKTMLLCGIINELKPFTKLAEPSNMKLLSYFFCQATVSSLNNATAVLKGLIYLLADQHRPLVSYIRGASSGTNHLNSRVALADTLTKILADPALEDSCIIIDALDECIADTDLEFLTDFIASNTSSNIKWIISSRNRTDINECIDSVMDTVSLSLELNEKSVTEAVDVYVKHKVAKLADRKKCDPNTKSQIQDYLSLNAHGTFLWVALVCKELHKCRAWDLMKRLEEYPTELVGFYHQMMDRVSGQELCMRILSVMVVVYRPITWKELLCYEEVPGGERYILDILAECGSFLTVKNDIIYFIHQSAKDFLLSQQENQLFPGGVKNAHEAIFRKSLGTMGIIKRDIYSLVHPGLHIDEMARMRPEPDPLIGAHYACEYWIDHLSEVDFAAQKGQNTKYDEYLDDDSVVHKFLVEKLLFWLEALSCIRKASVGLIALSKLEKLLTQRTREEDLNLLALIVDASRFIHNFRALIEHYPLQIYASGLHFSPTQCLMRSLFEKHEIGLVRVKPQVGTHWSSCLEVLDSGHGGSIKALTFSQVHQELAAIDEWGNFLLWNASDGSLKKMKPPAGHREGCLSLDGRLMASVSSTGILSVWDVSLKRLKWSCDAKLTSYATGYSETGSMAFSPDSNYIAIAIHTEMQLWDVQTGRLHGTCRPMQEVILTSCITFSPDSQFVAVKCHKVQDDESLYFHVFDVSTGGERCNHILGDHIPEIVEAVFLRDKNTLALLSSSGTIIFWDALHKSEDGALILRDTELAGLHHPVAFTPDGQMLAIATGRSIMLYSTTTGSRLEVFRGERPIQALMFSSDGKKLAAGCSGGAIWFWDAAQAAVGLSFHSSELSELSFLECSQDGKYLVSGSKNGTLQIWDGETGMHHRTLRRIPFAPFSVALSNDAQRLVLNSSDDTGTDKMLFWDLENGEDVRVLELSNPNIPLWRIAISPDGQVVAAGDRKGGVYIWNPALTTSPTVLEAPDHDIPGSSVAFAFAPSSQWLVITRNGLFMFRHLITGKSFEIFIDSLARSPVHYLDISPNEQSLAIATPNHLMMLDIRPRNVQEVCQMPGRVRFIDNSTVSTAWGILEFGDASSGFKEWGFSNDLCWITWNRRKCLWLPPEYRPSHSKHMEIIENLVVIGRSSGQVLRIKFTDGARDLLTSCPYQPQLEPVT